ncbi:MAG: SDR family oxidoreductase [Gemmataceae bacterium]|nr:SDR family oxidoreductase [Gemmataceae bacterium]
MARRSFSGLRVLVTGASQGIGNELAQQAVARGAKVLAVARNEALLKELTASVKNAGGAIETLVADVTSPTDRVAMLDAMKQRFGGLDVLLNNAGIGATGHFADADEARLRNIFEVNFFGLAELTRLAIPMLKQGQSPALVNISSIVGKRGLPGRSEYSASKFAVQGLSECLRGELSLYGIDVIIVNPGLTQTNFPKNMIERKSKLQVDHLRGMTAAEAARLTLNAIERGKKEVTFTFQGKLFVFVSRFFPRLVDRIAARRVKKLHGGA